MAQPRAHTPQIPLIDPAPALDEPLRDHALGSQEAAVFHHLVDRVGEHLQDRQDVDVGVLGRVAEGLRGPDPERDEAEESERVAGFGAQRRERQEGGLLGGRGHGLLLLLMVRFVLLDAREETQARLHGQPRRGG